MVGKKAEKGEYMKG